MSAPSHHRLPSRPFSPISNTAVSPEADPSTHHSPMPRTHHPPLWHTHRWSNPVQSCPIRSSFDGSWMTTLPPVKRMRLSSDLVRFRPRRWSRTAHSWWDGTLPRTSTTMSELDWVSCLRRLCSRTSYAPSRFVRRCWNTSRWPLMRICLVITPNTSHTGLRWSSMERRFSRFPCTTSYCRC